MKTYDKDKIEELVAGATKVTGYINSDLKDYEEIEGRYGLPSVAISTGDYDSVSAVIDALKQELECENLSTVQAGMIFIGSSKENGLTMANLSEVNSLLGGISENATIKRSVGWNETEEMNKISIILWR